MQSRNPKAQLGSQCSIKQHNYIIQSNDEYVDSNGNVVLHGQRCNTHTT
jgi:hypothetical protein